jgi:formylglycine-generating enzyme
VTEPLEPTGFWSYTRDDDGVSAGRLSLLRVFLTGELRARTGRSAGVRIFQDVATIPYGAEWDREIGKALSQSSFFIPIVTPGFVQSQMCCLELIRFREHEAALGRSDLIFPLHYIDTDDLDPDRTADCFDPSALRLLRARQMFDFRDMRFRDPGNELVMARIAGLAGAIRAALRRDAPGSSNGFVSLVGGVPARQAEEQRQAAELVRHEAEQREAERRAEEQRKAAEASSLKEGKRNAGEAARATGENGKANADKRLAEDQQKSDAENRPAKEQSEATTSPAANSKQTGATPRRTRTPSFRMLVFYGVAILSVVRFCMVWNRTPEVTSPPPAPVVAAPTVPPADVSEIQDCPTCPRLVLLPKGSFNMGVSDGEEVREKVPDQDRHLAEPIHAVTIPRFYMGKYTVTRAEYAAFIADTGERPVAGGCYNWVLDKDRNGSWQQKAAASWRDPGIDQAPDTNRHPAVCVSHDDAEAYVTWLSKKTGKTYRLPSEAEWEYAARAGSTTAHYWGDDRGPACTYADVADAALARQQNVTKTGPEYYFACDDTFAFTAPVGSFKPNGFGLYDVLGNVRQWTQDCWHDNYNASPPSDGSPWVANGDCGKRPLRGGSWNTSPRAVRSGYRGWGYAANRSTTDGFRVARAY